jgi:L-alanine-DL-glutamate epimerase-like enolase superfamily enzyme
MNIASIERIPLNMTFIPEVGPQMLRATTHGTRLTLVRVTLDNGVVGYGDSGGTDQSWVGASALVALRQCQDAGIQMACFDAVGQTLQVPAHLLMGTRVRSRVPFAYWTIDLPPDVLARQVQYAASLGYKVYKFKCRPWWDTLEQIRAAAEVAPPGFQLWLDFNGHLREARLALPILQALSTYACVGGFESPIPQRDVEGYKLLRAKIDRPLAIHYAGGACHVVSVPGWDQGTPGTTQLIEGLSDGFVHGGGDVDRIRNIAGAFAEFRKPFWIQTVGSALRAAWVAHVASTCSQGLLSSLAAHDLWERDVASAPRPVDGWMKVPEGPGLGLEVDEDAVRELSAAPETPEVRRISTVVYPSGVRWSFADEQQRHEAFYFGHLPGFVPGIRLEVREDDGSRDFERRHAECKRAPLVE